MSGAGMAAGATRIAVGDAHEDRPGRGTCCGKWTAKPGFGVYVHIPFCVHRCHYCDFNAYEGQAELHEPYVSALMRSIDDYPVPSPEATSVFFGGGTPTLLPPAQLGRVLRVVRERFRLRPGAEVTVEANPETVSSASFEALLEAGFNRFSVGVQSLAQPVLDGLGRRHSVQLATGALRAATEAGVEDLNADLIYGSVWELMDDWRASLEGVIEAGVTHVSAYALTVEDGTPLHTLVATGRIPHVDPDVQAERHRVASEILAEAGFERYEISNWARPGRACNHNVLYWSAGDYAGLGAGAHGHRNGRRWWNLRRPRDFIGAIRTGRVPEEGSEILGEDERAAEALVLGLRLSSGVALDGFAERFGAEALARRAGELCRLEHLGLIERSTGWLRLAEPALLVANDVCCRLL